MNLRRNDGDDLSTRARATAGAVALAAVAVGCVGFALGLQLDLGAVSLVGNALFVGLGVALAYATASGTVPTVDPFLMRPGRIGEVGFAFDFEDEAV